MRLVTIDVRRRGVALIAVLWIGLLAGLLLIGVRHGANVGLAMGHNELAAVQAHWLARAGIEQAIAILIDDGRADDSPLDLWHHDEAIFRDIALATGTFSVVAPVNADDPAAGERYGVADLAGRLNVNDAEAAQLEALPEPMTPAIAASILDWRDRNHSSRPGGAEDNYYSRLEYPYQAANQRLQTLEELRLVKGIDDAVFGDKTPGPRLAGDAQRPGLSAWVTVFTYDDNLDSLGEPRVNVNKADEATLRRELNLSEALAEAVVEERGNDYDSLMKLLEVEAEADDDGGADEHAQTDGGDEEVTAITLDWLGENLDRLTLSDDERLDARINVNTASHDVLMTLPDMTEAVADDIIAHRDSDAGPFTDVGDLRGAGVVDDDLFKAIAERVTVRSHVFWIHGIGESEAGVRREITAVVDRSETPVGVLYWYQSE